MSTRLRPVVRLASALSVLFQAANAAAQGTGYGVTANGTLFRFDLDAPAAAVTIGPLGIVPEGIDFRPMPAGNTTHPLYAIDVGATTTQLYRINRSTAAVDPVGPGFPSTVAGSYDLTGNNRFGFDFNPTTLQPDGSIRIRLIANNSRANLRINSDTGLVAVVDTPLAYAVGDPTTGTPFTDAAAYINNNVATIGGTTVLYDMDARQDILVTQNPANAGTINTVGSFGVSVDANPGIAFDIITAPGSVDTGIGGDQGFAVFQRTATQGGAYLLYDVNLATGVVTNGALVGGGLDFTGGFAAIVDEVPEPAALALIVAASLGVIGARRRR